VYLKQKRQKTMKFKEILTEYAISWEKYGNNELETQKISNYKKQITPSHPMHM
jgi:hypothetical protein